MSRRTTVDQLGNAIAQELTIYSEAVNEAIIRETDAAITDLVKKTKATAPVGARGSYKKHISADKSRLKKSASSGRNFSATWYVKAPDYRLTHLLTNGHATKDGGRTRPNPFLHNAVNEILPDYERKIEEAVRNGG